jgi:hypothetical protein
MQAFSQRYGIGGWGGRDGGSGQTNAMSGLLIHLERGMTGVDVESAD